MIETGIVQTSSVPELKARVSPLGALGLPPLLDKRRLELELIDDAFMITPLFDRVFVWQLAASWAASETYAGSAIYKAESTKDRERNEAPQGVLIAAGMRALDDLMANGIELGHVVAFSRMSPWRMPIAQVAGKEIRVLMLRTGDILGSYDLTNRLRSGASTVFEEKTQQHLFKDETGRVWLPRDPTLDFEE